MFQRTNGENSVANLGSNVRREDNWARVLPTAPAAVV